MRDTAIVLLCVAGLAGCAELPAELAFEDAVGTIDDSPAGSDGEAGNDTEVDVETESEVDPPSGTSDFEAAVLDQVNARRAEGAVCGDTEYPPAGPLVANSKLQTVARAHSEDMVARNFFNHTNPDGHNPGKRLDIAKYDYSTWGENIAMGQSTPSSVMDGWMASPGHCANIMNGSFKELGVGYAEGHAWTQVFAAPR